MNEVTVFQPECILEKDGEVNVYIFPDILYLVDTAFPTTIEPDDLDVWTHELSEPTIMALIIGETQFMDPLEVTLHSEKYGDSHPNVWHVLIALCSVSSRYMEDENRVMRLTGETYLKDFSKPSFLIDLIDEE